MYKVYLENEDAGSYLYGKNEEWKESVSDNFDEKFVILGNRDYEGIKEASWYKRLDEFFNDIDKATLYEKLSVNSPEFTDSQAFNQFHESFKDYEYSKEQFYKIAHAYLNYEIRGRDDLTFKMNALNLIYPDRKYEIKCIRGYSQSEWQNVLYDAKDSDLDLQLLEDFYFRKLMEISVEDENGEYVSSTIITDTHFSRDKLREILEENFEFLKDQEYSVFEQDGYIQVTKWKEVELEELERE